METGKHAGNCKESPLTGFKPSNETVRSWMEKLHANGITDGCLCRLIHGRDEDKIVKFENYTINDLGVCIDGGYFLIQDGDTLKVAEPLYKKVDVTDGVFTHGRFYGMQSRSNGKCLVLQSPSCIIVVTNAIPVFFYKGFYGGIYSTFEPVGDLLYEFKHIEDLYSWLAL
jgi:hypothetical protein